MEIVRLHGFSAFIVTERDKVFNSLFWRELFCLPELTLLRSTSYHPQNDGQTEVVNKLIETYLRGLATMGRVLVQYLLPLF